MALTDPARHHLHQRLDEMIGPDAANTLMAHLPSVTWADLATKDDLARQTEQIELRLRTEMADVRSDFHDTLRTNAYLTLGGVSVLVTMLSAVTALA